MPDAIHQCRICGNDRLVPVLDLGIQHLTGVFPKNREQKITSGPLQLVKCESGSNTCGLVQLRHSYAMTELYGMNYGYRSSLNKSMASHLQQVTVMLRNIVSIQKGDLVLDIGSNDGTLLSFFPADMTLVGIDPTVEKFREYYRSDIRSIPEFFSSEVFRRHFPERKAKIVTSIAMFYDLESPLTFMKEVAEVLAPDGIWHFEQSYLPLMMERRAYDTVCHEHREYYAFRQIKWMADRAGLKIIRLETNDVNGGSFAVTVAHQNSFYREDSAGIENFTRHEADLEKKGLQPFEKFSDAVGGHKCDLIELLEKIKGQGRSVLGYGASTKGNVILQFCGIGPQTIPAIAEVNEDKFGSFTPGTLIPIISERDARARKPDYFLVLPWHFKQNLMERESEFVKGGGRLIFPLPEVQVVGR